MTDLIDTTEMYLRTILELEEEGQVAMRARISERLDQSGPTVSETVARMQKHGLVVLSDDRHLELTDEGRLRAIEVMRKHRLAERLLADIIKLDWHLVHEEACRWEHVMSNRVERKILSLIDNPTMSPYGNPIPGLAELGLPVGAVLTDEYVSVAKIAKDSPSGKICTLKRIAEPLQVFTEALEELHSAGIVPGASVSISSAGERILVKNVESGHSVSVNQSDAGHLYVAV
jgi:DtxR family Mn-dependent transcriptional regulator